MNEPATELVIDGATLEGGGQVLRCCLSLAWLQHAPVRIHSIRAGRPKPGLANQHLAGAQLTATLAGFRLEGATKGSTTLVASPAAPAAEAGPSTLVADAQTAGAATLILQANPNPHPNTSPKPKPKPKPKPSPSPNPSPKPKPTPKPKPHLQVERYSDQQIV